MDLGIFNDRIVRYLREQENYVHVRMILCLVSCLVSEIVDAIAPPDRTTIKICHRARWFETYSV